MPTTSADLVRRAQPANQQRVTKPSVPQAPGTPTPDLPSPDLGPTLESKQESEAKRTLLDNFDTAALQLAFDSSHESEIFLEMPITVEVGKSAFAKVVNVRVQFSTWEDP